MIVALLFIVALLLWAAERDARLDAAQRAAADDEEE